MTGHADDAADGGSEEFPAQPRSLAKQFDKGSTSYGEKIGIR
jgi:hypothetical protein